MLLALIIHCGKHRHAKMALLASSLTITEFMDPGAIWFKNRRWEPVKGEGNRICTRCPSRCSSRGGAGSTSNIWSPHHQGGGRKGKKAARGWETTPVCVHVIKVISSPAFFSSEGCYLLFAVPQPCPGDGDHKTLDLQADLQCTETS